MTLDLIKANGCKVPAYAPNAGRYLFSAEDCRIAKMQAAAKSYDQGKPVEPDDRCDQSKWKPDDSSAH